MLVCVVWIVQARNRILHDQLRRQQMIIIMRSLRNTSDVFDISVLCGYVLSVTMASVYMAVSAPIHQLSWFSR